MLVGPWLIVGSMVTHYCRGPDEGLRDMSLVERLSDHGGSEVPPWGVHVDSMVSTFLHESSEVLPWRIRGCAMVVP